MNRNVVISRDELRHLTTEELIDLARQVDNALVQEMVRRIDRSEFNLKEKDHG